MASSSERPTEMKLPMAMPYLRVTVMDALPEPRTVSGVRRGTRLNSLRIPARLLQKLVNERPTAGCR